MVPRGPSPWLWLILALLGAGAPAFAQASMVRDDSARLLGAGHAVWWAESFESEADGLIAAAESVGLALEPVPFPRASRFFREGVRASSPGRRWSAGSTGTSLVGVVQLLI